MLENKLKHLAVIMDGNRRWAKLHNLDFFKGHEKGSDNIELLLNLAIKNDIKYLSIYAFSSENWLRGEQEIAYLKDLIIYYLNEQEDYFIKNQVRVLVIGEYAAFGVDISNKIESLIAKTNDFNNLTFIIALNYGARSEIIRAAKALLQENKNLDNLDENLFSEYLYTKNIPDPDLLIRTGGEKRLSNFLLWQLSYTELFFEDTMWPDFNEDCFNRALNSFYARERRVGK
ncbi:MAG: di-trans,poly-cis-decaprenylcistransferase [Alphaproteobacteria bacterium]|jgi:undecaprenyl diphosphate synthase|nr:di-trans,poly-cis-decaprenylcistransferase [Alphaproteobacteria bacterium]